MRIELINTGANEYHKKYFAFVIMCFRLRGHEKIHNGPQCSDLHDLLAYH